MPVLFETSVPSRLRCVALTALLAGAALLVAGCGQKGPLTMPQVPASAAASAPAR